MADQNDTEANPHEGFPDWFDAATHRVGPGGIYEAATGVLLGEDGEPASAALRSERATAAEVEAIVEEVVPSKPRKPRDTREIVEGAALAGGADATEQE